ncbi:hypothetical protein Hanom_Chr05g00391421 [Helianthus anomalus]
MEQTHKTKTETQGFIARYHVFFVILISSQQYKNTFKFQIKNLVAASLLSYNHPYASANLLIMTETYKLTLYSRTQMSSCVHKISKVGNFTPTQRVSCGRPHSRQRKHPHPDSKRQRN